MFDYDVYKTARLAQNSNNVNWYGDCLNETLPTPLICSYGSSVRVLTENAPEIRAIFLNIFFVINAALPVVGTYFMTNLNRHRIVKDKHLPSTYLVPWSSVVSVVVYWWKTRRLPAGNLAYFMLMMGALGIANYNVISAGIDVRNLPANCAFRKGVVVNEVNEAGWPRPTVPSSIMALSAQNSSWGNLEDGSSILDMVPRLGIYKRIPADSQFKENFFARDENTLGTWLCDADEEMMRDTNMRVDLDSFKSSDPRGFDGVFDEEFYKHFVNKSALFDVIEEAMKSRVSRVPPGSMQPRAIFAWSANPGSNSTDIDGPAKTVKAVLYSGAPAGNITLTPFTCAINGSSPDNHNKLTLIVRNFLLETALSDWTDNLSGSYDWTADEASPETQRFQLEKHLNAMVMSFASNASLQSVSDGNNVFSCLISQTEIGAWVFVLMIFEAVVAMTLFGMGAWYKWQLRQLTGSEKDHVEYMPNDVVSLQLVAIRGVEVDKEAKIHPRAFGDFSFGWHSDHDMLIFERNEYFLSRSYSLAQACKSKLLPSLPGQDLRSPLYDAKSVMR